MKLQEKLCHSLGSLEGQIANLTISIVDLQTAIVSVQERVVALERQHARWRGGITVLLPMLACLGALLDYLVRIYILGR